MKLQIKAEKFKEMVSRALKGASCNKLIPLTGLMAIELKDNTLTLITTDATNYLYVKDGNVEGDDFYVVVPVDVFSKLISRLTCENVSLEVVDNSLKVSGNGNYVIELFMDENGNMIKFPSPVAKLKDVQEKGVINSSTVSTILNTLKPSLSTTLEIPCYTGYYFGDKIVATNTEKVSVLNSRLFNTDYLISPEMMDLLAVMTEEKINVDQCENNLIFSTKDCIVYGPVMEGIEDFSIDAILEILESQYPSQCKLPKNTFLQLLDRLSLFVTSYDNHAITLTFTKEGLMIQSKASTGAEIIPYMASENFADFSCAIDITYLQSQVKAQTCEALSLSYGREDMIKFEDENIISLVSLLNEAGEEVEA